MSSGTCCTKSLAAPKRLFQRLPFGMRHQPRLARCVRSALFVETREYNFLTDPRTIASSHTSVASSSLRAFYEPVLGRICFEAFWHRRVSTLESLPGLQQQES